MWPRPPEERFWEKVRKAGPEECWEWSGVKLPRGYGIFTIGYTKIYSHRYAWSLGNGEIPDGMYVCHKCDNPSCCNPAHLFVGTASDNNADMDRKGRARRGVRQVERTHCPQGHEYTPENTRIHPPHRRSCITCVTERSRQHYRDNRERLLEKGRDVYRERMVTDPERKRRQSREAMRRVRAKKAAMHSAPEP
jgi:hypothetical protein